MVIFNSVLAPLFGFYVSAVTAHHLLPFVTRPAEQAGYGPRQLPSRDDEVMLTLSLARSAVFFLLLLRFVPLMLLAALHLAGSGGRPLDADFPYEVVAAWATVVLVHEFSVYALTERRPIWAKTGFFLVVLVVAFLHNTDVPLWFTAVAALGDIARFMDCTAHYLHFWLPAARELRLDWLHYAEMAATAVLFEASVLQRQLDAVALMLCIYLYLTHAMHVSLHVRVPRRFNGTADPFAVRLTEGSRVPALEAAAAPAAEPSAGGSTTSPASPSPRHPPSPPPPAASPAASTASTAWREADSIDLR